MTLADTLFEAYEEARHRAPHIGSRTLARLLCTSEGDIQAARLGRGVSTLAVTPCDLVLLLPRLGPLEVISQTSHASVASRLDTCHVTGNRYHASLGGDHALAMKFMLPCWYWVALSREQPAECEEVLPCLQIFDRFGHVLHRLYLREPSRARLALLECYRTDQRPRFTRCIDATNEPSPPDAKRLLAECRRVRHEEDFTALLHRYRLRRLDACRAVSGHYSQPISMERYVITLAGCCACNKSIEVSLLNGAGSHTHHEHFERFRHRRLDSLVLESETLTLTLDSYSLAEAWLVSHPGTSEPTSRLEAFDAQGRSVVSLGV